MKILHTGGASGSDYYFAWFAMMNNFEIKIHSFSRHKAVIDGLKNYELYIHSEEELMKNFDLCKKAGKMIHRFLPGNQYSLNLILRNYFQAIDSNCVFAVGYLADGIVSGGTGWTVQLAINMGIPVILFDEETESWYQWNFNEFTKVSDPPFGLLNSCNMKNITGIGTRHITPEGLKAIKLLFGMI